MKALLFLSHRIPYPPNKGDKIRSYHLLNHLSKKYRVHLGTFIDDEKDWQHVDVLKRICGQTCFVPLRPAVAKLWSLSALFTGKPMTLPYYFRRRLKAWVDRVVEDESIERIVVFSSCMAQYVDCIDRPGMRRILDFVDVDSDKWLQYSARHRWPVSWIYRREGRTLLRYERAQARIFNISVFVSEKEAEMFKATVPAASGQVTFLENGVDADYFSPEYEYDNPYQAGEQALVFTGLMDYWANVDAVCWFVREVFPRLSKRNPSARFYIVGARPADAVRDLTTIPGVVVTGAVDDVRPYLAHATAAVAPMRIARGVQNKVLEAMAMAKPVLVTPQAQEGIRPCPEFAPLLADTPAAMAGLAVALLSDGDRRQHGRRGRDCVRRYYNWATNLGRLEAILEGQSGDTGAGTPTSPDAAKRKRAG